ncbi:hypothetical protein BDN72DRAFT_114078 [Pluteus cervinus]|uniref:Uncharacterized protein n=1 Tax=Pluteus cervinus TaxID=181527 RepID=A0ACD3AN64_9AGAR|nr:hypothetical protein BDN72DRAFT_114078 [Pluteus cervinus]
MKRSATQSVQVVSYGPVCATFVRWPRGRPHRGFSTNPAPSHHLRHPYSTMMDIKTLCQGRHRLGSSSNPRKTGESFHFFPAVFQSQVFCQVDQQYGERCGRLKERPGVPGTRRSLRGPGSRADIPNQRNFDLRPCWALFIGHSSLQLNRYLANYGLFVFSAGSGNVAAVFTPTSHPHHSTISKKKRKKKKPNTYIPSRRLLSIHNPPLPNFIV